MANASAYPGPATVLELYEKLVAGNRAVERRGAKMPYTSRNGHMFSFLDPAGVMALRLPADLREEFVARYPGSPVEQHGRVMAEYVAVPDELLADTAELQPWFDRSHAWIGILQPKGDQAVT